MKVIGSLLEKYFSLCSDYTPFYELMVIINLGILVFTQSLIFLILGIILAILGLIGTLLDMHSYLKKKK
jgi:hypothetical protein